MMCRNPRRWSCGFRLASVLMIMIMLIIGVAGDAVAQIGLSSAGPRIGLRFDPDQLVLGGQGTFFDRGNLRFSGAIELGTGDDVTLLSFMPELHIIARGNPLATGLFFYFGGGLDIATLWIDFDGDTIRDTDVGLAALAGLEGDLTPSATFFGELRVHLHDNQDWFEIDTGVSIPIGR